MVNKAGKIVAMMEDGELVIRHKIREQLAMLFVQEKLENVLTFNQHQIQPAVLM